jgi:hypothetical protein
MGGLGRDLNLNGFDLKSKPIIGARENSSRRTPGFFDINHGWKGSACSRGSFPNTRR